MFYQNLSRIRLRRLSYSSSVTLAISGAFACVCACTDAVPQKKPVQREYVFTKGGVGRVDADGRFSSLNTRIKATFGDYANNFDLVRPGPDGSTIYLGGQHSSNKEGEQDQEKAFIGVYHLLASGQMWKLGSFAHGAEDGNPYAIAFGRKGRFLYTLIAHKMTNKQYSSVLSTYQCERGRPVPRLSHTKQVIGSASVNHADMITDPAGRFVYITQPQNRTINQYRVSADGSLKPLIPPAVSLSRLPSKLIFPSGTSFLYVVSAKDNSLTQLKMSANGTLHTAHFFQFGSVKRQIDPVLAITPNGRFLYVGNDLLPVTQQYAIGTSGAIHPLSPPTAAFSPDYMTVDLTSRYAYLARSGVTNQELVYPYRISPDGSLVRIKGDPMADVYPVSLTFAQLR